MLKVLISRLFLNFCVSWENCLDRLVLYMFCLMLSFGAVEMGAMRIICWDFWWVSPVHSWDFISLSSNVCFV